MARKKISVKINPKRRNNHGRKRNKLGRFARGPGRTKNNPESRRRNPGYFDIEQDDYR